MSVLQLFDKQHVNPMKWKGRRVSGVRRRELEETFPPIVAVWSRSAGGLFLL